jgi:Na+-translocating ferredoxin:NAD+ oxidoreductase RnfD subunit
MPLSEEELRLLEQMERALTEEDPKFASTLRGSSFRRAARQRALLAGVGFIGGIALLMTGAVTEMIPVAVLGFVVMLATATYALSALRARPAPVAHDQGSLHDRMDRWRHRHED